MRYKITGSILIKTLNYSLRLNEIKVLTAWLSNDKYQIISNRELSNITKIELSNVNRALKGLVEKKVLETINKEQNRKIVEYKINLTLLNKAQIHYNNNTEFRFNPVNKRFYTSKPNDFNIVAEEY